MGKRKAKGGDSSATGSSSRPRSKKSKGPSPSASPKKPRLNSAAMRSIIAQKAQERKEAADREREEANRMRAEGMVASVDSVIARAKLAQASLEQLPFPLSPTSTAVPSLDGRGRSPATERATPHATSPPASAVAPSTTKWLPSMSQPSSQSFQTSTSSLFNYDPNPNPAFDPPPIGYYATGRAGLGCQPSSVPFRVLWGNPATPSTGPILYRIIVYSTSLPPTLDGLELWFRDRDPIRVGNCHLDGERDTERQRSELVLSQEESVASISVRAGSWVQGFNLHTDQGRTTGWSGSGWVGEGFELTPGGTAGATTKAGGEGTDPGSQRFWCCGVWGSSGEAQGGKRVIDSLGLLYAKAV